LDFVGFRISAQLLGDEKDAKDFFAVISNDVLLPRVQEDWPTCAVEKDLGSFFVCVGTRWNGQYLSTRAGVAPGKRLLLPVVSD
jgi:hypothetical protein